MVWFAMVFIAMVWLWPVVWFVLVRNQLQVEVRVSRRQMQIGEQIQIECDITNRGWMPCPTAEVVVSLPDGLVVDGPGNQRTLRLQTYIGGRQTVVIRGTAKAIQRGVQSFANHPVYIILNEGFGLRSLSVSRDVFDEVVVLPNYTTLAQLAVEIRELSGQLEIFRWLHPDESLLRGIRPYQRGDDFKHIAWAASASAGEWMVKQYASSTDATIVVVVNAQFQEQYWYGTQRDTFDALAEQAATFARFAASRGYTLRFATNATLRKDPLRTDHGRQSAAGIRSLLGQFQPYANQDFAQLWHRLGTRFPSHTKVVLFTAYLSPVHRAMLRQGPIPADQITVVECSADSISGILAHEKGVDVG